MVICIFVYVIGIPVVCMAWLWRHRHLIQTKAADSKTGQEFASTYSQLFASYNSRHFYFEGVEMIKKMTLAGGLVLVAPGSSVQILVGILVALAFLVLVQQLRPYEDATDNKLQTFATVQIILTLLSGLVIQTDVQGEYEQVTMSILLLFISGSVAIIGLISTAMMLPISGCYGRSRVLQNSLLREGALKKLKIFEHLPEEYLKKLHDDEAHAFNGIGTVIFAQGAKADKLLVIARGIVSIRIDGVERRKMKAPEVLGEKALVADYQHRRGGTAVCASKSVEILYLRRKDYDHLVCAGVIDSEAVEYLKKGADRWSSKSVLHTQVVPMPEERENVKNHLANIRAEHGASSKEYLEAARSAQIFSTNISQQTC